MRDNRNGSIDSYFYLSVVLRIVYFNILGAGKSLGKVID